MSSMLSSYCISCLIKRQADRISSYPNEELKKDYLRQVLRIIYEAKEEESSPVVLGRINLLHREYFGAPYSFEEQKSKYNRLMLTKEAELWNKIQTAPDKIYAGLQLSRIGNYIDFGAQQDVDEQKLNDLLTDFTLDTLDQQEYYRFRQELKVARRVAFLTDNCGEIVLDKLLIRIIKDIYPQLQIDTVVRGGPVLNDATQEDAQQVGLAKYTRIIPNGTQIAGTYLPDLSREAKESIMESDLILAKGQGNFETMHGCGLNIYYSFLCKCDWFVELFGMKRFTGVFINEIRLQEHQQD